MPIIEEWTAWLLVRERERQLTREELIREAERARARTAGVTVLRARPQQPSPSEHGPDYRRAA